jgi:hypothetical protein
VGSGDRKKNVRLSVQDFSRALDKVGSRSLGVLDIQCKVFFLPVIKPFQSLFQTQKNRVKRPAGRQNSDPKTSGLRPGHAGTRKKAAEREQGTLKESAQKTSLPHIFFPSYGRLFQVHNEARLNIGSLPASFSPFIGIVK